MKNRLLRLLSVVLIILVFSSACAPKAATSTVKPFRIALVLSGTIDDASWNTSAYQALLKAKSELGVETSYTESVAVTDAERVIRDYANQGYNLIIGHSFDYGDALLKAAADFPNTYFAFGTGLDTAKNVAIYDVLAHESSYVAGLLAGNMTKSKVIGIVGAQDIPTITIQVKGFEKGVAEVNPDIKVLTTFVGSWDDSQGGQEAAAAQISAGADLIFSMGDYTGIGAAQQAEKAGVIVIGSTTDQINLAPKSMLTSVVTDFWPVFKSMIVDAQAGTFKEDYTMSMKDGATYLAPYHNLDSSVSQNIKDLVKTTSDKIIKGDLVIEPEWPQ